MKSVARTTKVAIVFRVNYCGGFVFGNSIKVCLTAAVAILVHIGVASADIGRSDFGISVKTVPRSTGTFCTSSIKMKWTGDQKELADRGVPLALLTEGLTKIFALGIARDVYTGMEFLQRAGEKGVGEAHYVLGRLAILNPTEIGREEAEEYFSEAVRLGCPEGFFGLALLAKGEGQVERAIELTDLAIEFGSTLAEVTKVYLTDSSRGEPTFESLTKKIKKLEKLRKTGNQFTESSLAALYLDRGSLGENGDEDFLQFLNYLGQAADKTIQGEFIFSVSEANFNLALVFSTIEGRNSFAAFLKAACLYSPKAMINIGLVLLDGNGVEMNLQAAQVWFRSAQSDPLASQQVRDKATSMVKATYEESLRQGSVMDLLSDSELPELILEQCQSVFES